MKKILIAIFVGTISIVALTNLVFAQNSSRDLVLNRESSNSDETEADSYSAMHSMDVKKVNTKAVADFKGRFSSAMNEKWFEDKSGYTTVFMSNGFRDRAYYDKKGHWLYSLIYYGEERLDKNVRAQIKSTYYDFSITLVEEVQMPEGKGYIVHLEDRSTIRILRINSESEMTILQELSKS